MRKHLLIMLSLLLLLLPACRKESDEDLLIGDRSLFPTESAEETAARSGTESEVPGEKETGTDPGSRCRGGRSGGGWMHLPGRGERAASDSIAGLTAGEN